MAEHDETFQGEVGSRDSEEEGAESSRPGTGDGGGIGEVGDGGEDGDGGGIGEVGDGGECGTSGRGRPFTASSHYGRTEPTAQLVTQGEAPYLP